jgi:hypothetical protein
VQGQHWNATLISLLSKDYLLEDEQGLRIGEMLTVNFINLEYLLYISFDYDLQLTRH